MNTKLMKNMGIKKKKKGFTLIELIIVIAILAVLAALALPKFGAVRESANKSADITVGKNIQTQVAKLIAEDKITVPTVGPDTAIVASTSTGAGKLVADSIDGNITAKYNTAKAKTFSYSLDKDGNIAVYITGSTADQIYPTATGIYAN